MRLARVVLVALGSLVCAGLAMATPASIDDVNFGIKDPTCGGSCVLITSSTFTFTMPDVPQGHTIALNFFNSSSNVALTSLKFDLFTGTGVSPSLFTCSPDAFFDTCLVTQITSTIPGDNEFQLLLENLFPHPNCHPDLDNDADDRCGGIQPGVGFELEFTNPAGTNTALDWANEDGKIVVTGATPEPATVVLLVTGLVPLWSLRRKLLS